SLGCLCPAANAEEGELVFADFAPVEFDGGHGRTCSRGVNFPTLLPFRTNPPEANRYPDAAAAPPSTSASVQTARTGGNSGTFRLSPVPATRLVTSENIFRDRLMSRGGSPLLE